jgi:hypothetical protein
MKVPFVPPVDVLKEPFVTLNALKDPFSASAMWRTRLSLHRRPTSGPVARGVA